MTKTLGDHVLHAEAREKTGLVAPISAGQLLSTELIRLWLTIIAFFPSSITSPSH